MSHNETRGRGGGVDTQSGVGTGVHVQVEGTERRLTVQWIAARVQVRGEDLGRERGRSGSAA